MTNSPDPRPNTGADTRPKKLAWIALSVAIAGFVLSFGGLLPIVWVGLVFAIVSGLLLIAGLILGIMVLAKRTQGGKPLGIVAIIVSVLGGVVFVIGLGWSLILIGMWISG